MLLCDTLNRELKRLFSNSMANFDINRHVSVHMWSYVPRPARGKWVKVFVGSHRCWISE